jgi:transposase
VVAAAARATRARTRRARDQGVEDTALAAAKKNARRRRAWLVFEDESGLSQQPVVCRTWAPRGETPVLTHASGNWKRLSVAGALAFRWDGRRARFFFQTQPGSYTDRTLIAFLRDLRRHFRRRPVILIWDGLPAHRSRAMRHYLARQRRWLTAERLPGYAPELNPVESIWGNIKRTELANFCAPDLDALRGPLRRGCARVRCHPPLAFNFLRHAGLAFRHGR